MEKEYRELVYQGHDLAPITNEKGETRLVLAVRALFAITADEYKTLVEKGKVDIVQEVKLVLPELNKNE